MADMTTGATASNEDFWSMTHLALRLEGVLNERWDRTLPPSQVKIYEKMGMVLVKGKLFRVNLKHLRTEHRPDKWESMRHATNFKVCTITPHMYISRNGTAHLAGNFGMYAFFFGSSVGQLRGIYQNSVLIERWSSGWRTCDLWVRLLQRRARRARQDRKVLPFAMGLHARLGGESWVERLGADLVGSICKLL